MTAICLYFQVHQPRRLRNFSYFEIGHSHYYEDEALNRAVMRKVAEKCYLPACALLLELIERYPGQFCCAFSLSGVFLEQCKLYTPQVLESFQRLVATGQVELLNETYAHSLSAIFAPDEFKRQVQLHRQLIQTEFGVTATTFRNTELIFSNQIAALVAQLGYQTILAEGAEKVLGWRSPNFLYHAKNYPNLKLLLRNYSLTDDIAFRFSERSWREYPINAEKYSNWLHVLGPNAEVINLFMDFETLGEHQWQESGIFDFIRCLPEFVLRNPYFSFRTPHQVSQQLAPVAELDVPYYLSWADEDRDLSAWCGNHLQDDALQAIYGLQPLVYATHNSELISTWQHLLTSDHFYYLCTKYAADGDVHKYFSPYSNPYEAYINYMNIVADFKLVLQRYLSRLSTAEAAPDGPTNSPRCRRRPNQSASTNHKR